MLVQISDPEIRQQQSFGMVLCRCYIYGGHAELVGRVSASSFSWHLYDSISIISGVEFLFIERDERRYIFTTTTDCNRMFPRGRLLDCSQSVRYAWEVLVCLVHMSVLLIKSIMTFHSSLEPNPEYWEGKRGACIGALYSVISERNTGIPPGGIMEICALLRESISPQAESIVRVIRRFASDYWLFCAKFIANLKPKEFVDMFEKYNMILF